MSVDPSKLTAASGLKLDPAFRSDVAIADFRDAMASLAATACLVTARDDERRLGRTVTAAFSLSAEPPAIMVSIDRRAALADAIRRRRGFSFALMSTAQRDVADAFAGKVPAEGRFEHGEWQDWPSGHPRLGGAVAAMDCAVIGEIELGGHVLFVGGLREIALNREAMPLVWHHRQYNAIHPL
ncbi:flavin reductase [Lutimaribacter pacificus]|uniref:Flavin reductase n=1 Tax=Lutimaribacter pacificus TaxID=391948 RepID=A0A1H0NUC2_9RHOB|nr:flavin reductase family protein [Lutimaribacter pacificus]SDO96126.1 flavin reductase [Lutimaribacter pacificus]SHK95185.1 flavin reductase [Lutimaribacter pacificus]